MRWVSRPLTLGFRYLFLFGLYAASLRPDICRLLVSYRPLALPRAAHTKKAAHVGGRA